MIRFQCPHCRCVVASETWEPGAATICANCSKEVVMPVDRLSPGAVLGDFILYHKLGEGGMGRVYMAHQMSLDRPAAIKVLKAELSQQADSVQAFIREARSAAKLNHPSIVQAYAVGEEEGIFYFAMEYIDGKTMKDVLKEKGKLDPKEAANVVRQIADALDCAWTEQKLIHHDVKPENIMQCANDRVKLADLGLAGKQGDDANDDSDEVVGSMHYISPEQMTGAATDTRSDIYSLGATFYHFVTGQFPYTGENLDEVARQHVYGTLVPPRNVNPDLPQVLNDIIVKMMDKNPDGRFQNCKELSKALLNFIENGSEQKSAVQLGGASALGGAAPIGGGLAGGLGNGAQPRVLMPAGGSKLTLKIAGKKEEEKTPAAAETPAVAEAPAAEANAAAEAPAPPKPVIRLALKKPASEPVQSESANAETPEAADQDSAVAAAAESAVKADDLPAAADSENKNEDCEIETAEKSPEEAEKAADGKKKSKLIALIAGVVVVLLAAAGAGVWFYLNNVSENGKKEKTAETEPSSAVGKFVIPVAEVQETETPAKEPEVAEYKSPVAAKGPALSAFMKEANSLDALYLSNEAQFVQAWKRRGDKLKPKTAEEKKLYKALDENYVLADERVTVEPARKPLTAAYTKR